MKNSLIFLVTCFFLIVSLAASAQQSGPMDPSQCPTYWTQSVEYKQFESLRKQRDAQINYDVLGCNQTSGSSAWACQNKSDAMWRKRSEEIGAAEEPVRRRYEAARENCLGIAKQNKENYERQQDYNRHAQQAQQRAHQQAEQQRIEQFNKELAHSNAEREAYNRAAQERAEQQQRDYQRQAEAAQKAAELRAEQQRQAQAAQAKLTQEALRVEGERHEEMTARFKGYTANTEQEISAVKAQARQADSANSAQNATLADIVAKAKIKAAARKAAEAQSIGQLSITSLNAVDSTDRLSYGSATSDSVIFEAFEIPKIPSVGTPKRSEPDNPAASQRGVSGYKLLHKGMQELNSKGVLYVTSTELDTLRPQVLARMPSDGGGVLICVATQQWERPDATGARAKSFVGAYICGTGTDRVNALERYFSASHLGLGASEGWKLDRSFVWATLPARVKP